MPKPRKPVIAESLAGASLVLFKWVELDISAGRIVMMPAHLVITLYLVQFLHAVYPRASVQRLTLALGAAFVVQLTAGMLNIVLQVPVWMQLTHLFLADLVWMILVLLSAEVLWVQL